MSGENVVRADFSEHRKEIDRQNSPFGPIQARIVEIDYDSIERASSIEQPEVKRTYSNYLMGTTSDPYNPALEAYDF